LGTITQLKEHTKAIMVGTLKGNNSDVCFKKPYIKNGIRIPYNEINTVRTFAIEYEFRSYTGSTRVCIKPDFIEKTEIPSKLIKYAMNNTINEEVIKNRYLFLNIIAHTNVVTIRRTEIIRSESTVINIRLKINAYDSTD